MKHLFTGLWRHTDFRKLWAGQSISFLGDQVTLLALPITATILLHANALQMSLLRVAGALPRPLFGLFIGVGVDRFQRRPLMIVSDLGRMLLLGSIPLAAFLGLLRIEQLYLVVFLAGLLTLIFEVAQLSLLPTIVPHEALAEGNSKLEISRSGSLIVGPGIAGLLVQAITAPMTIIMDALSFLGSAACLAWIRTPEPQPKIDHQRSSFWSDLRSGISHVIRHPFLGPLALSLALFNFFLNMLLALYVLYVIRVLEVSPALLGGIYALGNVGFLLGVLLTGPVMRRFGVGPTIVWWAGASGAGYILLAFTSAPGAGSLLLLAFAQFLYSLASPVTAITQLTLRQAITPYRMQGRVNGTMRFLSGSIGPVGALLAGALGEWLGLHFTWTVAVIGLQLGFFVLVASPIRKVRELSAVDINTSAIPEE